MACLDLSCFMIVSSKDAEKGVKACNHTSTCQQFSLTTREAMSGAVGEFSPAYILE